MPLKVITTSGDQLSMQNDLSTLLSWSVDWQMLFNIEKCKVMHFGHKRILYLIISWKVDIWKKVTEEKDLGIVVSNDLKVSKHCSQAYAKANKLLGVINRTIVYKSSDILLQLYKSLVRPHIVFRHGVCITKKQAVIRKNPTPIYPYATWNEGITIYPASAKTWSLVTRSKEILFWPYWSL